MLFHRLAIRQLRPCVHLCRQCWQCRHKYPRSAAGRFQLRRWGSVSPSCGPIWPLERHGPQRWPARRRADPRATLPRRQWRKPPSDGNGRETFLADPMRRQVSPPVQPLLDPVRPRPPSQTSGISKAQRPSWFVARIFASGPNLNFTNYHEGSVYAQIDNSIQN